MLNSALSLCSSSGVPVVSGPQHEMMCTEEGMARVSAMCGCWVHYLCWLVASSRNPAKLRLLATNQHK